MGTHPIFESDFDCLTEMSQSKGTFDSCVADSPIRSNNRHPFQFSNWNAHLETTPLKSQRGYQSDSDYSSANTTPEKLETHAKTDYHMQSKFPSGGIESKTNLIINYLPPGMNHETLRDLFRCIGEVDQVKLCKNKETKLSLGYGFVKYKREEDAMKAVQQLNGRTIQNKRIKVSFARPSSDIIKNTNLYVSGLPKSFVNDDIKKFFGQAGKIISVRILTCKETGMSRGVCFVRYDTKPEAENAVHLFNGKLMPISGTTLTVKFASPTEPASNIRNENRFRNQLDRPTENSNNQGRRFGKSISHHNLQNMSMRYSEKNFPILISVTNLPLSVSEKDIWAMFGPFGAVTYVSIVPDITDPASEGTATATVSMPIYDEAIFAIRTLNQNGAKFENNKLCVAFKVSSPSITHKMNDTQKRENLN